MIFVGLLAPSWIQGAETAELLRERFRQLEEDRVHKPHDEALSALNNFYGKALDQELTKAKNAADLERALAVRNEKEAIEQGNLLDPQATSEALLALRKIYLERYQDLCRKRSDNLKAIVDELLEPARESQTEFTKQGNLTEALAVREFVQWLEKLGKSTNTERVFLRTDRPGERMSEPVWDRMSDPLRKARQERGGRLKMQGDLRNWPQPDLGMAAEFDDFVRIGAYGDCWYAQRLNGKSYVGSPTGVVELPEGTVLNSRTYRYPGVEPSGHCLEPNGQPLRRKLPSTDIQVFWGGADMDLGIKELRGAQWVAKAGRRFPNDGFFRRNLSVAMSDRLTLGFSHTEKLLEGWDSIEGRQKTLSQPISQPLRIVACESFGVISGDGKIYEIQEDGTVTVITEDPNCVDLMAGAEVFAAQAPDGTWKVIQQGPDALSDPAVAIQGIGPALALVAHADTTVPFLLWIEPPDSFQAAN